MCIGIHVCVECLSLSPFLSKIEMRRQTLQVSVLIAFLAAHFAITVKAEYITDSRICDFPNTWGKCQGSALRFTNKFHPR